MERTVFAAAAAGLLHDIGKFASRAGQKPKGGWEAAKREAGYAHAQMSWDVVQEMVPAGWAEELRAILYHHHLAGATKENAVDPELAYRLALADWLSSGEREPEEEPGEKGIPYVLSPFSRLCGHNARRYYPVLPLAELDLENAMPAERTPKQADQEFKTLWNRFAQEAESRLKQRSWGGNEEAFLEALYALLEEYTWCVPSAYAHHVSDVSLFDHARTTAAIAVCLAADGRDAAWCAQVMEALRDKAEAGKALERETALLVIGDISGVQKFIYTITSSGAAKSLRGRSFYLQLLTEAMARCVLRELGLPVTNMMYAGGGNFVLLVPASARGRLVELQQEVTRRLLEAHEGGLHLTMAWYPVQAGQFRIGSFAGAWEALHRELRRAKNRPLVYLDDDTLSRYLGRGMGAGGDRDTECSVCGREEKGMQEDEGIRKCKHCRSFEELGNALARAKWLVSAHFEPQALPMHVEDWHTVLQSFGMDFWAVEDLHQVSVGVKPALVRVTSLENRDVSKETRDTEEVMYLPAYRFFAQLVPWCEQPDMHICTFDELCERSTGGFKRWGVLRMDVDNLGKLFREGFTWKDEHDGEVNHLTLSRAASLSFALRLFFEGLLPGFAGAGQRAALMEDRLYLQYAGGDDLFIVGSWDALPIFALGVRERFRQFVCGNPAVTLSAGIALAPEKYPLYQAAEDAGQAEERAKHFRRPAGGREKDACCFLGFTMDWGDMQEARQWQEQFTAWCGGSEPKVPRALLQLLVQLYAGYREEREQAVRAGRCQEGQVYFGPWMWRLAYYLARRRADSRMPEEVRQALEELEGYMLEDPRHVDTIGLAARWAHYLVR